MIKFIFWYYFFVKIFIIIYIYYKKFDNINNDIYLPSDLWVFISFIKFKSIIFEIKIWSAKISFIEYISLFLLKIFNKIFFMPLSSQEFNKSSFPSNFFLNINSKINLSNNKIISFFLVSKDIFFNAIFSSLLYKLKKSKNSKQSIFILFNRLSF